jgi:hypothetical protein
MNPEYRNDKENRIKTINRNSPFLVRPDSPSLLIKRIIEIMTKDILYAFSIDLPENDARPE